MILRVKTTRMNTFYEVDTILIVFGKMGPAEVYDTQQFKYTIPCKAMYSASSLETNQFWIKSVTVFVLTPKLTKLR